MRYMLLLFGEVLINKNRVFYVMKIFWVCKRCSKYGWKLGKIILDIERSIYESFGKVFKENFGYFMYNEENDVI